MLLGSEIIPENQTRICHVTVSLKYCTETIKMMFTDCYAVYSTAILNLVIMTVQNNFISPP